MKTAVMTDSNSGITKEEADRLGIFLLRGGYCVEDLLFRKRLIIHRLARSK